MATILFSEKQIECSLHHFVFDLETGKSTNANCNLKTKKLINFGCVFLIQ
mgnify:CR=1 FL=1